MASLISTGNHGARCGLDILIGLRHPLSLVGSMHAVVMFARHPDSRCRSCNMFDGTHIVVTTDVYSIMSNVRPLLESGWRWMTFSDIATTCHGVDRIFQVLQLGSSAPPLPCAPAELELGY